MIGFKHRVIGAGLSVFAATRLHRLLAPLLRGRGAILTFHHVRPRPETEFAPNGLLEITPEFLDELLRFLRQQGYAIVPLDAVPELLGRADDQRFVALTFDDGYRDNVAYALPLLEAHEAPFTVFATTGFLDRTARLWWVELEAVVRSTPSVTMILEGASSRFVTETARDKASTFETIRRALLARSDTVLLAEVERLSRKAAIDPFSLVDQLCLDWIGLVRLAAHPLATVGCHTVSHPRLALLSEAEAVREMDDAQKTLEYRLGRPVRHLAYPYGSRRDAGTREFALARALGFDTAVTTRPGVLHRDHAARLTALPRLSINGLWPTVAAADVLLSGAASTLWNRGRRIVLD